MRRCVCCGVPSRLGFQPSLVQVAGAGFCFACNTFRPGGLAMMCVSLFFVYDVVRGVLVLCAIVSSPFFFVALWVPDSF